MSKKFKNSVEFANTKLLLENYRNIQIAINCRGEDEIFSKNHTKISEKFCVSANTPITDTQFKRLISADNYRLIGYLEHCIDNLRTYSRRFEKYYSVLFYTYLSLEKYDFEEILEKTGLKKTAYYTNLEQAITTLSTCMWGVSAVKTEGFSDLCLSFVKYVPAIENEDAKYDTCSYLVENLPRATSREENEKLLDMIRTLEAKVNYDEF